MDYMTKKQNTAKDWLDRMVQVGKKEPFCAIAYLTPEIAELLLNRNPENRSKRPWHIEEMAEDIDQGRFEFTGQSIVISRCGLLNDGQNRCEAVALAGKPIELVFVFGVDREARKRMDIGRVRTVGDFLGMDGVSSANNFAAAANYILKITRYGKIPTGLSQRISKAEVTAFAMDMLDELAVSFRVCKVPGHGRIAPLSLLMTAHFLFSKVSPRDADAFLEDLIRGTDMEAGDPVFVVRDKLMDSTKRLNQNEKLKSLFMAWNNRRVGKKVASLTHSIKRHEKLPELKR